MKNKILLSASATLIILVAMFFSSVVSAKSFSTMPVFTNSTVQFSISIPDQFSSFIVREENENTVNFSFKDKAGKTAFLFSVNKISVNDWFTLKEQLSNYQVLENRNGVIYFVLTTSQQKIRSADGDSYSQVVTHLGDWISSIKITE